MSGAVGLAAEARARWALRVHGTVQAVGFRPAVYRLAHALGLAGWVRNDADGVTIEIEGARESLDEFRRRLEAAAPPRARIEAVESFELAPRGETRFCILDSASATAGSARVPVDLAPCDACLAELADPADRRHRHPFINCTDCGPRYTIIRDVPYDRARTTMDAFAPCAACAAEYADPASRRFHAEPIACPACGPQLRLRGSDHEELTGEAALAAAVRFIAAGRIVAVKGVGGFLLATDACSEAAVARLRVRKQRPHKPFAVMARDLAQAARIALLDDCARGALLDPARPVVLLPRRPDTPLAPSVAPALREVGVMLPSTPLHHLLLSDGPPLQVMTSGNLADEPITGDDPAPLAGIADALLTHERAIHTRADDSVVRVIAAAPRVIRRARGFAPEPLPLAVGDSAVLAVGAELKSSICVAHQGAAFVSQHLGDLSGPDAFALFEETVAKLTRLVGATPKLVAHDLHPDHRSTRWALAQPLPRIGVQHHHAHIASCLAENGRSGAVIGVAFDGTGCGPDGQAWGGEILVADLRGFRRVGHLRELPLIGGDAAVREPWRLALAALRDAELPLTGSGVDPARRLAAERVLAAGVAVPRTSSAGRWFDAVAALCGVRDQVSYEAQAAIELDAIALDGDCDPYPFTIDQAQPFVVDLRPAIRAIAAALSSGSPAREVAARFYETVAEAIACSCARAREACGLEAVALSGGCFQSARLTERSRLRLAARGFEVLLHRRVPPNDGGLALGQAAVAACRFDNRSQ